MTVRIVIQMNRNCGNRSMTQFSREFLKKSILNGIDRDLLKSEKNENLLRLLENHTVRLVYW